MVEECGLDQGDCALGCSDGSSCYEYSYIWNYFLELGNSNNSKLTPTYACEEMYPVVAGISGLDANVTQCYLDVDALDYNQDGLLEFREYQVFAAKMLNIVEDDRAPQLRKLRHL